MLTVLKIKYISMHYEIHFQRLLDAYLCIKKCILRDKIYYIYMHYEMHFKKKNLIHTMHFKRYNLIHIYALRNTFYEIKFNTYNALKMHFKR